jgi:hypothetical protein
MMKNGWKIEKDEGGMNNGVFIGSCCIVWRVGREVD